MPENERTKNLKVVGKPVRKKDAMELLSGTARYTADIAPRECLVIRMLRSPYNNLPGSIRSFAGLKVIQVTAVSPSKFHLPRFQWRAYCCADFRQSNTAKSPGYPSGHC